MSFYIENMLDHTIAMSVIIVIISLVFKIFRKYISPNMRYFSWIIILIGLFIPIRPVFTLPKNDVVESIGIVSPNVDTNVILKNNNSVANFQLDIITIFQIVWLVGFIIILIYNIRKYQQFKRVVHRWSSPIDDENTLKIFLDLKDELKITSNKISVWSLEGLSTPLCFGFISSKIILPSRNYNDDEIYYVLKHELIHFQRKDLWIKSLALTVSMIHWFNPFIHFMVKKLDIECEASCDKFIAEDLLISEQKNYAESIISSITVNEKTPTVYSTQFLGGAKDLKERITSIFEYNFNNKKLSITLGVILAVMVLFTSSILATNNEGINQSKTSIDINDSRNSAKKVALKELKGGNIISINDVIDDGEDIYSIIVKKDNIYYEVDVLKKSNKVIDIDIEDENVIHNNHKNNNKINVKISSTKARDIALKKCEGGVVKKVELDYDTIKKYEIEILKKNRECSVDIDADTGKIINYELDDDH